MQLLKKILVVLGLALLPTIIYAATAVPWQLTNPTDSVIIPSKVNGVIKGIVATSTTQIYINGNRIDSYTADGTQLFPYKTITDANTAVAANTSITSAVYYIAPATYAEQGQTFPAIPLVIHSNGATILALSGANIGAGTFTFPSDVTWYDASVFGNVAYTSTSLTNPHTMINPFIAGDVSYSGLAFIQNGAIVDQNKGLFPFLAASTTGALISNAGSLVNVSGSQIQVVVSAAGFLNIDDAGVFTSTSTAYAVTMISGGQLGINGATIMNGGTGGGINCADGATSAVPNEMTNFSVTVGVGTPAANAISCGSAFSYINMYVANTFAGTRLYAGGTNLNGLENVGLNVENNSLQNVLSGSKSGFGSSSPFANVSIHANAGDLTTTLFAIGSSTSGATTTLFTVDNTGTTRTNANTFNLGYSRVGSNTAPNNTTAGDITSTRLSVGNTAFGGGSFADFNGTITDTSNVNAVNIHPIFTPSAANNSQLKAVAGVSVITGTNNFALVYGGQFINDWRATSTVSNGLFGVSGVGAQMSGLANNFTTINQAVGAQVQGLSSFSNTVTGTVNNAIGLLVSESVKTTQTVTNDIGIKIAPLFAGTNNIGILMGQSAAPSGQWGIYNAATSTNYFAGGLLVVASSTIGDGTNGLTVLGAATSTGIIHDVQNSATSPTELFFHNTNGGTNSGVSIDFGLSSNVQTVTSRLQTIRTNSPAAGNSSINLLTNNHIGGDLNTERFEVNGSGNIGIASTSPYAQLSVHAMANQVNLNPILFAIGSSTASATSTLFSIDNNGHLMGSSTSPTASSCGTGPTVNGDDAHGYVTVGSTASGCTITFANAYPTRPSCIVQNETGSVTNTFSYAVSATAITVTETSLGGDVLDYSCRAF